VVRRLAGLAGDVAISLRCTGLAALERGFVLAPEQGVATIERAAVAVVAVERDPLEAAFGERAFLHAIALVAVAAVAVVGDVEDGIQLLVAGVLGAGDRVALLRRGACEATELDVARLLAVAEEIIQAEGVVRLVETLALRRARVHGAFEAVVASVSGTRLANAVEALPGPGAGVLVIAGVARVRQVVTAVLEVAQVVRAGVVVGAIQRGPFAGPLLGAEVPFRAGVAVVAIEADRGEVLATSSLLP
jgi:hypothetical protein